MYFLILYSTKNPWKTNVLVHVGLPMSGSSPVDPRISVMFLVRVNMNLTASRGMPKMCCCRCRCRCRCCCCWIESIKDRFWEKRHWFFPCHDKFHLSSCQTLQCLDSFTYTSTYIYIYIMCITFENPLPIPWILDLSINIVCLWTSIHR